MLLNIKNMDIRWTIDRFKVELVKFIGNNSDCNRNKIFKINFDVFIPDICVLQVFYPTFGRIHYLWKIDTKIFDPTIHQFTNELLGFSFAKNNILGIKAFQDLKQSFYDQLKASIEINDVLLPWYNNFETCLVTKLLFIENSDIIYSKISLN